MNNMNDNERDQIIIKLMDLIYKNHELSNSDLIKILNGFIINLTGNFFCNGKFNDKARNLFFDALFNILTDSKNFAIRHCICNECEVNKMH